MTKHALAYQYSVVEGRAVIYSSSAATDAMQGLLSVVHYDKAKRLELDRDLGKLSHSSQST